MAKSNLEYPMRKWGQSCLCKLSKAKAADPNYAQLRGHVPNRTAARFKAVCSHRGIDFGAGLEEALEPWIEKEEKRLGLTPYPGMPASLAEFVKAHYFELSEQEVPNISALAKGGEPCKADCLRIAKALNHDYQEIWSLALKSFPESTQLRSTYEPGPIQLEEEGVHGAI